MIANPHRPTTPAPAPAPLAPTTPVVAAPKVMKHELQPDWGMGLIVEDDGKYLVLYFERGGLKKFIKDKAKVLVPVTLTAAEMTALKSKANGRSKKPRPEGSAKKKAKAKAAPKARFITVTDQITAFEKLFEGGFKGDAFVEGERGKPGVEGKEGLKEAAIAFAQKTLSKEAFAKSTPEELFENARLLLKATNIVFPIEGAIPFAGMDPENRTKALAALKDLLHGTGDYADRLEAFLHRGDLIEAVGHVEDCLALQRGIDAIEILALEQEFVTTHVPGDVAGLSHDLLVRRRSDEAALGFLKIALIIER